MSKVAIVYWSGTGNTASMAESVADGVKSKGGEAELFECSGFGADMLDNFDAVAFGCPAMGADGCGAGRDPTPQHRAAVCRL